jgi:hypothetical protein
MMAQYGRNMSWQNKIKEKISVAWKTVYFVYEVYINATGCLNVIWDFVIYVKTLEYDT